MNGWFVWYSDFFVRERAIFFSFSPFLFFLLFFFSDIVEVDGRVPLSQSNFFSFSRLKRVKRWESLGLGGGRQEF